MLSPEQSSVGTQISVEHKRASAIGEKVSANAVIKALDGKRIVFDVSACDSRGIIGQGEHTRVIIDSERFMSRVLV